MSSQDDYKPSQIVMTGDLPRRQREKRKAVIKAEASRATKRLFAPGGALDSQTTESQYLTNLDPEMLNSKAMEDKEGFICGKCDVREKDLEQLQNDYDELLRHYTALRQELTQVQVERQGAIAENIDLRVEATRYRLNAEECREDAERNCRKAEEYRQQLIRVCNGIPTFNEDIPEPGTSQGPEWWEQVAYPADNKETTSDGASERRDE